MQIALGLGDTARPSQRYPPIARYGVFGVSTWPMGCHTPSPFSETFPPWRACEVEVRYAPAKKKISAILARYHMKTRQMGAIPPSLSFLSLLFWNSLFSSLVRNSLFCRAFSLLLQGFQGFDGDKNPCFLGGFPSLFPPQKKGKEGQGSAILSRQGIARYGGVSRTGPPRVQRSRRGI